MLNSGKQVVEKGNRDKFDRDGETKNIPKNVGKQIIKFVKENRSLIELILERINSSKTYTELNESLQQKRKKMIKIS